MENTPENPLRLTAISYESPDILKITKPHDPIPKSDKYYFWGDNRIATSLKLNAKTPAISKKAEPAKYSDPAALSELTESKSIFLYYVDDWDAQNDSVSFFAQ